MTRARQIDGTHDWLFGRGQNDYVRNRDAVAQSINTRLNSFLGDCFFDTGAGLDWFNLLGSKNQVALNLAISAVILNTAYVTGILQLLVSLSASRNFTIEYRVQTAYSAVSGTFTLDTSIG